MRCRCKSCDQHTPKKNVRKENDRYTTMQTSPLKKKTVLFHVTNMKIYVNDVQSKSDAREEKNMIGTLSE